MGADRVGAGTELLGNEECPFSGVAKYGSLEERGAGSVALSLTTEGEGDAQTWRLSLNSVQ